MGSEMCIRDSYYSFCASGFFCGIAGALFAINFEILTEENLNLATSGSILLITFLGGIGVFFGPIVGAIVFTLLQTVLSLQTELWQLYLGALFLATVMFFPDGLSGVLMRHANIVQRGRPQILFAPYAKMAIPALVTVLASAGLCEVLFHSRHAATGEHSMVLYWITIDTHSLLPWVVLIGCALGGFWLCKRIAPDVLEAWDEASRPGGVNP